MFYKQLMSKKKILVHRPRKNTGPLLFLTSQYHCSHYFAAPKS